MKVSKPVIVFDLETTGTWIDKDKIIEIAMIKILPDGTEEEYHRLINPEMPIPDFIAELTGVSDDDVRDQATFRQVAQEILDFINDSDFAGFNIDRFDLPLLIREFNEVGLGLDLSKRRIFDAQKVYHVNEKRDLTAAYKFYCGKDLEGAHSALADTRATLSVLKSQIETYGEGRDDLELLGEFNYHYGSEFYDPDKRFRWWNGELYMMFGKYAKRSLQDVAKRDPNYLEWILSKDFNDDVKHVVEDALNGKFPTQEQP